MTEQKKITAYGLFLLFLGRWFVGSVIAWFAGILIFLVLLVIIQVMLKGSGASQAQMLQELTPVAEVLVIPIVLFLIPLIGATIAFFWMLNSSELRIYMLQRYGDFPQPTGIPGVTGASAQPGQPQTYDQYVTAYQKWQQEYAEYQRKRTAQPQQPQERSAAPDTSTSPSQLPELGTSQPDGESQPTSTLPPVTPIAPPPLPPSPGQGGGSSNDNGPASR